MEGSKHIVKLDFIVTKVVAFENNRRANQLSMWGDRIYFIFIVVGAKWENRAVLVNGQSWGVIHDDWKHRALTPEKRPLITIIRLEDQEFIFGANYETAREGVACVDAHTKGWIEDVRLIFTVVGTEDYLAIVCADEDHSSGLWPGVACVICRNIAPLLNIVDLGVVVLENCVVFLLALLHIHEGVARTSDKHGRSTVVIWVVWNLEVADIALDVTLSANAGLRYELLTLPIPQKDLPVGLTRQSDDEAVFLGVEGARDKFLRVIRVDVLDLLGQSLLPLLARDIVDGEFAFLSSGNTLTHRYVLLALRDSHVGDGLGILRTYNT